MRSLEELVCSYQQNRDTNALNEIIERCGYIVKSISRKYFIIGGEMADVNQEGFIGLINAVNSFECGKGKFAGYAAVCINNAILSAVRKSSAGKQRPLNDGLPLADYVEELIIRNPEDTFIEGEEAREFTERLSAILSPMETRVLSLYLTGLSYAEIEEKTGKPVKAIDNALQRVRNKLKGLM